MSNVGKIIYGSVEELHEGVRLLVMSGITFEAHTEDLTIILTGGY